MVVNNVTFLPKLLLNLTKINSTIFRTYHVIAQSKRHHALSLLCGNRQALLPPPAASLRTNNKDYGQPLKQEELKNTRENNETFTRDTIELVNEQISKGEEGRLFAVVHIAGKQFIVTQEDIIIIQDAWPPTIGDKINFEKVLLVGSRDFTLIGRPVLSQDLVSVKGTVVDKDLTHVKTKFRFQKRQQFKRINFIRSALTMVRINEVKVIGKVNAQNDIEGLNKVFY